MDAFPTLVLAVVQGITEFLPVSSSGHLTLAEFILKQPLSLDFDIFLHGATLLSALLFFFSRIRHNYSNFKYVVIGSIPAGISGVLFKTQVESLISSPRLLPLFFLITSILLFTSRLAKNKNSPLNYKKALIIGLFQAFAILPGVSRSAATLTSGLLVGLSPTRALEFSFFLFIPATLGALFLGLPEISTFSSGYLIPFILTFIVGLFSLRLLNFFNNRNRLWYFGFYTLFLSLFSFLLFSR